MSDGMLFVIVIAGVLLVSLGLALRDEQLPMKDALRTRPGRALILGVLLLIVWAFVRESSRGVGVLQ